VTELLAEPVDLPLPPETALDAGPQAVSTAARAAPARHAARARPRRRRWARRYAASPARMW